MNRRELLKAGVHATALAAVLQPLRVSAQTATAAVAGDTLYLNQRRALTAIPEPTRHRSGRSLKPGDV